MRRTPTEGSGRDGDASSEIEPQYNYELVWFDPDEIETGSGYVVQRLDDGQKLMWQQLPKRQGLESIEVSGESFHMTDLQNDCFAPGCELRLVPEPDNPYGSNAVGVRDADGDRHAGYIPSAHSTRIGKKIAEGKIRTCFSIWQVFKDGQRVSLRILIVGEYARLKPIDNDRKGE